MTWALPRDRKQTPKSIRKNSDTACRYLDMPLRKWCEFYLGTENKLQICIPSFSIPSENVSSSNKKLCYIIKHLNASLPRCRGWNEMLFVINSARRRRTAACWSDCSAGYNDLQMLPTKNPDNQGQAQTLMYHLQISTTLFYEQLWFIQKNS